jgi:hypothetical protein
MQLLPGLANVEMIKRARYDTRGTVGVDPLRLMYLIYVPA